MKRCARCGCFFINENNSVCHNCVPYDNNDKAKLTDYCTSSANLSFDNIMYSTGIAPSNLTRFLSTPDFKDVSKEIEL